MTDLTSGATFADYGTHFQQKIVQCLLIDRAWAEQMVEVLEPSYFDIKYLRFLAETYVKYTEKYRTYPSLKLLISVIKDELKMGNDLVLRDQIINYLKDLRTNPDMGDLPMVKEKSLDFCKRQKLKKALEKTVELIETEKYDSIVDLMKTAIAAGTAAELGHDFYEDREKRFELLARDVVPTGIPELDAADILQGGSGRGELHVVAASTGVGKSHFLTQLGCHALKLKKNVLHYTFELSESKIGIRYDSNLVSIDSNEIISRKDEVLSYYATAGEDLGRLRIKYYNTNTASVQTLRNHIERLSLKGFIPDLIIIDYADIMRSSRQFEDLRRELKMIYEELRGFASELNVPIWTASQSNKEGSRSEVVDMDNMSESYGKAMVADFIVGLSRKPEEKATGRGRIYVAKNRNGKDGLMFPVIINTARSQIEVVGDRDTPSPRNNGDKSTDIRESLRDKLKEMQERNGSAGTLSFKKVG